MQGKNLSRINALQTQGWPPPHLRGQNAFVTRVAPGATRASTAVTRHNATAMRKLYLSLFLPLLMLLSQQGAVWHEIGHLRNSSPLEQKQQPADKLCETCLSFAHLSAAAKPEVPVIALPAFTHVLPSADPVPFMAADAPTQRSRGPPVLL